MDEASRTWREYQHHERPRQQLHDGLERDGQVVDGAADEVVLVALEAGGAELVGAGHEREQLPVRGHVDARLGVQPRAQHARLVLQVHDAGHGLGHVEARRALDAERRVRGVAAQRGVELAQDVGQRQAGAPRPPAACSQRKPRNSRYESPATHPAKAT